MNPPTTGHQLLVNKLIALAQTSKSTPRVYLSHSVGKKDPLPYDKKIAFARAAFGAIVRKSNSKNVIQILKDLEEEGFTHVTMVVGSDRVPDFTRLLNTYNGKEYTFEKIDVKSAGERDPDADDVTGMSASKMRALAKDEKVAEFLRGAPNTLKAAQAKSMYTAVRKALLGENVMEYGHDEKFLEFIFEQDTKEDDDLTDMPSDGEISKHFDSLHPDDLDLDDADAMMLDVILGNEEEEEEIKEAKVLSIQQRQKLSQRMKAMSKRLARLRQIKAKQMPAQQRLRMRARKAAIMLLRKRATGKKDLDYASLSKSQRVAVDTALVQRFGNSLNRIVDRLSTRLLPRVRKHAQEYVKKAREEVKEQTLDPKTKKHVSDQKQDNPLNLDALKLNILNTDPQKNDRAAPDPKQAHLHKNKKATHFFKTFDEGRKSSADKDARDAGDTNIIYQMRKTINSRGEHETVFADGHKANVSIADAKKLLAKFEAIRMPADKQEFTIQAGKSLSSFKNVLAHGVKQEKKKISLGGKSFKEFYLGVGRSRTVSAYDNDEPPGTRRVAEAKSVGGVEPDANDDPNVSRKPNPKLDLLLRLGLADTDELQKYRRALRSSKKQALGSPEMRKKLADLLDKLIDIVTGDPSTYSRVRYKVQAQEAISLVNKAEKSGVDVTVLAEVFMREIAETSDNNRAFNRVNSFIAGGKAAELDSDLSEKADLPHKYRAGLSDKTAAARKSHWDKMNKLSDRDPRAYEPAPGDATAKTKPSKHTLKYKRMYGEEAMDESSETGLAAKAKKSGVSLGTLKKVYRRGVAAWNSGHRPGTTPQQWGMARVNSYITKGKGTYHGADKDLREDELNEKGPGLWANIHAKRQRIKAGSGERMRKPGSKGAPTADQIRAAKSEETQNEGQANWAKARKENERSSVAYLNRAKKSYVDRSVTPYKADDAKIAADSMKDFVARGGKIQQLPPGKKTIKSLVKPKKYMTPNQASKITEQNMTTHDAVPLSKRVKRVKSFHAFHPPVKETVQRDSDIRMVKVRMPDGTTKFRKERAPAKVQQEMYTGSEPTTTNPADPASRFVGTNAIRQTYANVTPGQGSVAGEIAVAKYAPEKVNYTSSMAKKTHTEVDQSKDNLSKKHFNDIRKALGGIRESHDLNEAFAAGFELAPFARDYGMTVQSAFEHHPDVERMMDESNTKTTKAIVYKDNKPFAIYPDMKSAQKEYYGKDGYSIGTVSLSKSKALKKLNPGLKIVEDSMDEATYQGRKVPLNKPMKGDVKKSKVYVDPDGDGKAKKINFGDKNLSIKKDQPARKRSYCARSSGQGNLTKKDSANYWSRRAWNC